MPYFFHIVNCSEDMDKKLAKLARFLAKTPKDIAFSIITFDPTPH